MVDFLKHNLLKILYMWRKKLSVMEPGDSPLLSDSSVGYLRQCEIWVSYGSVEDSSLLVCCTVSTGKQLLMFWRSAVNVFPQVPFYCFHQSLSHHNLSWCITYSNYNCSWIFVFFKCVTESGSSHFCFVWIFNSVLLLYSVFWSWIVLHTHTHVCRQTDGQTKRGNCWLMILQWRYYTCSAAKAPYLARFRVQRCGIKELEKVAMAVSHQQSSQSQQHNTKDLVYGSMTNEMWQAAIFKVSTKTTQIPHAV